MSGRGSTWYKRDPIRFMDGVEGMGPELIGAYAYLLDLIYSRAGFSRRDDGALAGRMGCSKRKATALTNALIERGKIQVSGEFLTQKEAEQHSNAHRTESERNASAGRKGGEKSGQVRKNKALSEATASKQNEADKNRIDKRDTNVSLSEKTPSRKTRIREDAEISDGMRRAAEKRGHSQQEAEAQFQKFKNDALAKGKTFASWDRAFVTWLDSEYFRPITTGGTHERSNTANGSGAAMAQRAGERFAARFMDQRTGSDTVVPLLPAGRAD